ncbi:helix-turn-helix transcriptional regulator [bacterium]|nr:helix-turn-helix transcriptional regulator [bacterium]
MQIKTGNDLRAERARRNVTRAWLTKITGIPLTTLASIENGDAGLTEKQLSLVIDAFERFDNRHSVCAA